MPTPRKRLAQKLNPGRTKKGYLSPDQRAMIIHAVLSGEPVSTIATRFRVHRNTIRNTVKRYSTTNTLENKLKTGAPSKLSGREKRAIYRRLRQNPGIPYIQLLTWVEGYTQKKVSQSTIRRALQATGLKHWKSLKRIYLDKRAVAQRRQYVREWRGKEDELSLVRLLFLSYSFIGTYFN
jgi:transposase